MQHVTGATSKFGGTLDLIITGSDVAVESVDVDPPGIISDHGLVSCCIPKRSHPILSSNNFVISWRKMTDRLSSSNQEQSCRRSSGPPSVHLRTQTIFLQSTIPHSTISRTDLHHSIPFNQDMPDCHHGLMPTAETFAGTADCWKINIAEQKTLTTS